jgi:hypothetical protein
MKLHSKSRDLAERPAPLLPAHVALRSIHESPAAGRDSRPANHASDFTHHSPLVTHHCPFLIGTSAIKNRCIPLKQHAMAFSNRSKYSSLRAHLSRLLRAAHHQAQPAALRFLIATRRKLEMELTRSQQTRKVFLIATFSGTLAYPLHLAPIILVRAIVYELGGKPRHSRDGRTPQRTVLTRSAP